MVSGIEIRHLRVFLQLVREKNATRVGDDLGLSQQAVSAYLKRIRTLTKHELFVRHSNGFEPTEFAYKLAERVEALLLEFDALGEVFPFSPSELNRTVRVMANEYSQITIIPRMFQAMNAASSKLRLEVTDFTERGHEDALASGAVDIVIGFVRSINSNFYQHLIRRERFVYVVGPNTSLKDGKTLLHFADYDYVSVNDGSAGKLYQTTGNTTQNMPGRNVVATLSCYTSLKEFLRFNDAVARVPKAVAASGGLTILDGQDDSTLFDVVVAWHRRTHETPFNRWLIDQIKQSESI